MKFASTVSLLAFLVAAPLAGAQVLQGMYSLQGKKASTDGHLKATPIPGKPLSEKLDFWMTAPGKTIALKDYEVEMTKKMHVVIVSNDFKWFTHVHPDLDKTGHLALTQTFPGPGTYQIYADAIPDKIPDHQVFRFQLNVGGPSSDVRPLPATGMSVNVGPYEVDMSSVRLQSGKMNMINIEILKDGKPAKDLHPYLGAPAHAVFLDSKTLSYVHAHPMAQGASMDMSKPMPDMPENGPAPSDMMLHLSLYDAGTYKLWLQFRGDGCKETCIAPFTINVN